MAYDHDKVARTYRIDRKTARRIKALSAQLQSFESPLIDMLLQRALDEVEAGRWPLHQEPVKFIAKWGSIVAPK